MMLQRQMTYALKLIVSLMTSILHYRLRRNQGLLGVTQNIRKTANAGKSSYGVDFTSLTSSMPNGQMLREDQYKSGETSEINVVDGGSVSSDGLE